MRCDCAFIHGEFSIRFLANGWFIIRFSNPLDKDDVWDKRSWFVQGLNFVLIPWMPNFKPFFTSITHMDRWIKNPFLPTEYWSWTYLAQLTQKIGNIIKLDRFTLSNDDKAQFARVCLNINISKPVPRSITIFSGNESSKFFLFYEGVHEVYSLFGTKGHFLSQCPKSKSCASNWWLLS